jgi:hypothetical protein
VAHLVRPVVTSYELSGKRVPKGTPKAKKVRQKAAKWYGQGGFRATRRRSGFRSRRVSRSRLPGVLVLAGRETDGVGSPSIRVGGA